MGARGGGGGVAQVVDEAARGVQQQHQKLNNKFCFLNFQKFKVLR